MPDNTRRLAQELVVNDKVAVLAGFGITPSAMATAPIATQSKTPMVVMAAATSAITEASPFIVRTSFTLPQAAVALAEWAAKNRIKKVVTLVADYGPGIDAEKYFADRITLNGGLVLEKLRTPLRTRFRPRAAEGARHQPGRAVRLPAVGPGRSVHEAVCRARPGQGRHQADRNRRRDRRRPTQRHGRRGAGRGHLTPLFGGPRQPDKQEVRRRPSRPPTSSAPTSWPSAATTACA